MNLLKSITQRYMIITFLAIGTAIPVSRFLMNNWLNEFSDTIQLDPVIFIFSATHVLFMSCIATMYPIIKILNVNPVDSIKHE